MSQSGPLAAATPGALAAYARAVKEHGRLKLADLAGPAAGLTRPLAIGRCTADAGERRLADGDLPEGGWEHTW